ncbi:MAG TPA: hypothetical protein VLG74_10940 [Blastocatellia bacterium]|nr:hypothetical protein [Blastocatellia bacterium]
MPKERSVLTAKQRDALFTSLKDDPKFRELIKKDWRAALKKTNVNPDAVVRGTLSRTEIENFASQRAGWTIEIVIFNKDLGLENIAVKEALNFEAR